MTTDDARATQTLYHGTRADLVPGDLIHPGYAPNFGSRPAAAFVYLTATLEAAAWGAQLARAPGRERIYVVEPTGPIEDDPNLTDKRFPGNPTLSYRSRHALRVVAEVERWTPHPPAHVQAMRDRMTELERQGVEIIED
ncbi:NAD(+)--rifampin ADP-ribosyltransferase [Brevundimonas sp. 2R-24]|uniref:NAD(+)--rifampin ADP-ribosyltransferase n=1 Tax=Peiella sedimenti TaxID=3061083 RepID=A0ABT8SHW5_9CAUL|nr:NAD(+)--rifampin ADP-ribosyltransferase [Caulobacteraceae bacterium XZ-24]